MGIRVARMLLLVLAAPSAWSENPYLKAAGDQPATALFRGTEWGDELGEDQPLSAQVSTTRIAKMSWGEVYRIDFKEIKSRAKKPRQLHPEYFITTDQSIILLNEEDNEAAAKKLAQMPAAPEFEQRYIYGIKEGKLVVEDPPWKTTITLKGDQCIYETTHNSGHFKKVVWKEGIGLIEYAAGYGARADGYRLKRAPIKKGAKAGAPKK